MFDRALAIAPGDLGILAGKAETYQAQGNLDAAWEILRLHPFPPFTKYAVVAYHEQYYLWRNYGALITFIHAMDRPKNSPPVIISAGDVLLANLYLLNGQRDLAIPHAQKAEQAMQELRGKGFGILELSGAYIEFEARLGHRDEVEHEIQFIFTRAGDDQWLLPSCESSAAAGYTLLGDFDKALPLLQDSLAKPNGITTAYLRLNPAWDSVRNDPRFQKLLGEPH